MIFSVKKLLLVGFLLLALPFARNSSFAASSPNDRLYEVSLNEFPRYRALWQGKLGPTPFNYGRMIAEPAFAPEYSVAVYSRSIGRGEVKYFVTYIAMDRSLWHATTVGKNLRAAERAEMRRIDCEIPKETALKVRQAWLGMLSGKQGPRPMREEDVRATGDATIAEFSIQLSGEQALYGELVADLPSGPKTRTLVEIANALADYCKVQPRSRPAATSQIDRKVTRLIGLLKHRR
jgi:hypothetical protein